VLAVIAILASLLLPALVRTKSAASSTECLNNLKQLQLGWLAYVDENNDSLPPNIQRRIQFDLVDVKGSWVLGNAQLDTTTSNIEAGVLFPYVGSAFAYRCPADKSTVRNHPSLLRSRSYSMQMWLNSESITGNLKDQLNDSLFNRRKYSRLVDPPPERTWVFIEEHERSIDDSCFKIGRPGSNTKRLSWLDFRADRHNNRANLSFADGRVESHPWRFRYSSWPGPIHPPISDPLDREDLEWLMEGVPHSP
jgi:prepilin-type processing-associated H-X9-DG protein